MAVTIAEQQNPGVNFSHSNSFSSPLCLTFDGITGGTEVKQLLVTNTDLTDTLTNLQVSISAPANSNYNFLTIRTKKEEADSWQTGLLNINENLTPGGQLSFWVEFTVANNTVVQNIKNLNFDITWTVL